MAIVTSRFNNETWSQNCEYKRKHDIGCLYGSPSPLSCKIIYDTLLFVVEMNNSLNRIEGIGLIRNSIQHKNHNIYSAGNNNRYVFKSQYRVDREILIKYNQKLVETLDYILFKEKTHLKRGSGITLISEKLLKHDKCKNVDMYLEIKNIFKIYFIKPISHLPDSN